MGRAQDRQRDKMLKSKLTDQQFEELKTATFNAQVKAEVDRFIGNFVVVFKEAMKEFHISTERSEKIIASMFEKTQERFQAGDVGESKPNDSYIEADQFEETATRVLKENVNTSPAELAKILYEEIMKAGTNA